MTDTTVDATTRETITDLPETDEPNVIRGLAELVGYLVIAAAMMWGVYSFGKRIFYDDAFNDGFEAGRASIQRACANPDRSLAAARGCPL